MKCKNLLLPLNVLLFLFVGCGEDGETNNVPSIPSHRYTDNHTCEELTPTFEWESTDDDGDPLTYSFAFGESENELVEVTRGLTEAAYAFTPEDGLQERSVYYWQVKVTDGKSGEISSPVWSFTTLQTPTASGVPTIPVLFDMKKEEGQYVFSWSTSSDIEGSAITYDFHMERLTGGGQTVVENLTETSYAITEENANTGNWVWYVVAKDTDGNTVSSAEGFASIL